MLHVDLIVCCFVSIITITGAAGSADGFTSYQLQLVLHLQYQSFCLAFLSWQLAGHAVAESQRQSQKQNMSWVILLRLMSSLMTHCMRRKSLLMSSHLLHKSELKTKTSLASYSSIRVLHI